MVPLSAWTQYLWRGGGGGKAVARPGGWGQFLQVGLTKGELHFPILPWPGVRCSGCWGCWGRNSGVEPISLSWLLLLSWFTQRVWPQLSALLYGIHKLDLFGTLIGNLLCPTPLPTIGFIYQKADADGNENGIVKLDHSLSKQRAGQCHSMHQEMELHHAGVKGHHLAPEGRSSTLWIMKAHLMPSRPKWNCRSTGGMSTCELILVNAQVHDDGTLIDSHFQILSIRTLWPAGWVNPHLPSSPGTWFP